MTRDDIIQRLLYNRYKYNRQQEKDRQAGNLIIQPWYFYLPHLKHEVHIYSLTEHPNNWSLPSSVRPRYRAWD